MTAPTMAVLNTSADDDTLVRSPQSDLFKYSTVTITTPLGVFSQLGVADSLMRGTGHIEPTPRQRFLARVEALPTDGDEAVDPDAKDHAARLAFVLPSDIPPPEDVDGDPDGQVVFEWWWAPRETITAIITRNGDVSYAALFGGSEHHGFAPSSAFDRWPPALRLLLRSLCCEP